MFRFLRYGIVFCALFLVSCTSLGTKEKTVEDQVNNPQFRSENLPIRTLKVAVIANEWVGDDFVLVTFRQASDLFEKQAGIRFAVTLYNGSEWNTRSFFPIHLALREFRSVHRDYDIIIGISLAFSNDDRPCFFGSCYVGMIDDGRNIALLTLSRQVVLHEVGHAFLGIWHSSSGVMKHVPESEYFSVSNRKKILREKWKDFRYEIPDGGGN